MNAKLSPLGQILFDNAGFAYKPGEDKNAAKLAHVRKLEQAYALALSQGYSFVWQQDDQTNEEYEDTKEPYYMFVCLMKDLTGNVVESLGGIDMGPVSDPTASRKNLNYSKVIEAEMAYELLAHKLKDVAPKKYKTNPADPARANAIKKGNLWALYSDADPDTHIFEGSRSAVDAYVSRRGLRRDVQKGKLRIGNVIWEKDEYKTNPPAQEYQVVMYTLQNEFAGAVTGLGKNKGRMDSNLSLASAKLYAHKLSQADPRHIYKVEEMHGDVVKEYRRTPAQRTPDGDLSVERMSPSGGWIIAAMIDGERVSKRYLDYSRDEAVEAFRAEHGRKYKTNPAALPKTIAFGRVSELRDRDDAHLIALKISRDGNDYFIKKYPSRLSLETFLKTPGQWKALVKNPVERNMLVHPAFQTPVEYKANPAKEITNPASVEVVAAFKLAGEPAGQDYVEFARKYFMDHRSDTNGVWNRQLREALGMDAVTEHFSARVF